VADISNVSGSREKALSFVIGRDIYVFGGRGCIASGTHGKNNTDSQVNDTHKRANINRTSQ